MENMAHYMCHTVITQTVKSSPFHFFYSSFHQMCVKCHCKALILARKSVQPFIISSHLNSFSFRLSPSLSLFLSFSIFCFSSLCVLSLLRDRKICEENKEITRMAEICLMSYGMKQFKRERDREREIHLPSVSLTILSTAAFTSLFVLRLTMLCVFTHS